MSKKIAIIGRGTAGCLSYLRSLTIKNNHPDLNLKIEWYYDSNSSPVSVGEGTTPNFSRELEASGLFPTTCDLDKIDARPKIGISYENWGESDYIHPFAFGEFGVHFNANKFQDFVFNSQKDTENVTILDKNVSHEDMDSDLIIDCSGKPKSFEDYDIPKYIPVNAVHVQQCKWNTEPKYLHTKTISRKWGWVFVIPLTTRCSVGYLYNKDISTLEDVKEDIIEVIDSLDATATSVTNSFHFDNYVRKKLIEDRVVYAGNSGFFLEPMEATSLDGVFRIIQCIEHKIQIDGFDHVYNWHSKKFFKEVEYFIMMHYAAGSKWKNEFWDFAQYRGKKALEEAKLDPLFGSFIKREPIKSDYSPYFNPFSWEYNLKGLGLEK